MRLLHKSPYDVRKCGRKDILTIHPSLDTPVDRLYPAHTVLKETGLIRTENLANLGKIVGKRFKFIGFPLKIRGVTGSPIRAVAVLEG